MWWEEEAIRKSQLKQKSNFSDTIKVSVTNQTSNKINKKLTSYSGEIDMLAQLIYTEARGIPPTSHKAAVAWCVLNRLDSGYYGSSIEAVIKQPSQFAWRSNTPVTEEFRSIAKDVVTRWLLEKEGIENVGRVLPNDYYYFNGKGGYNHFRSKYKNASNWNWSLSSPY